MKKVLVIIFLIVICAGYFFSMKGRIEKPSEVHKKGIEVLLKEEEEKLTNAYPETVKEVVEAHNRIMEYEYSEQMEQGLVDEAVRTIRLVYSKELLALNPAEQQEFIMVGELLQSKENKIVIISSAIEEISYSNGEKEATVTVKHFTTKGDKLRKYALILEEGKWKIESWEDVLSSKTEEE